MKITQPLFANHWMKNGRRPARPPYRFTEMKKLELKDRVTSGMKASSGYSCTGLMTEMMNCLKDFEFDQAKCNQQITAFKTCYQNYLDTTAKNKMTKNRDVPVPGQNKLSQAQVNYLLKNYQQPR